MQDVLCRRGWFRTRRRMRRGRAEARERRASRRRQNLGGDQRQCGESGWPEQQPYSAQWPGTGSRHSRGPRVRGRRSETSRIYRGAWYRYPTWRSPGGSGAWRGFRRRSVRNSSTADRIGEDEHRSFRGRCWRHGPDQGYSGSAASNDSTSFALRTAESSYRVGRSAASHSASSGPVGANRWAPHWRRQFVRIQRHKRPRRPRRIAAARGRCRCSSPYLLARDFRARSCSSWRSR